MEQVSSSPLWALIFFTEKSFLSFILNDNYARSTNQSINSQPFTDRSTNQFHIYYFD